MEFFEVIKRVGILLFIIILPTKKTSESVLKDDKKDMIEEQETDNILEREVTN